MGKCERGKGLGAGRAECFGSLESDWGFAVGLMSEPDGTRGVPSLRASCL